MICVLNYCNIILYFLILLVFINYLIMHDVNMEFYSEASLKYKQVVVAKL